MIEDHLRRAMNEEVGNVGVSSDVLHRAQMTAIKRRHRRDNIRTGIGASALSILAVLGLVSLNGGSTDSDANSPSNLATGRQEVELTAKLEATEAPSKPPAASAERPKVLVGAATSGRLVTIDPVSGKTTKLLTKVDDGALLGGVSLTPDSTRVLFDVKLDGECSSEIRSVMTAGGTVSKVADGSLPAISPDGKKLAFVRNPTCGAPTVVVMNLDTRTELVIANSKDFTSVAGLTWAPDGTRIVADFQYPNTDGNALVVLDPTKLNSLASAKTVDVRSDARPGTVYEYPAFVNNNELFVSERCCTSKGSGNAETSRMLTVDLDGKVGTVLASGYLTKTHTSMTVDKTGSHFLYLSGQDLMVSDKGDRPAPLAHGLVGATWR